MSKVFNFKQFAIQQDRCAMKIGTDGVLLGAWTSLRHDPSSILDIGTGTGIIALMLAQRSAAEIIDALEVDDEAFQQAVGNFEDSSWGDRLFCYHASFDEFVEEMQHEDKYELITSNPPFYSEDYFSGNIQRDRARFTDSLPFSELLKGVSKLLSANGKFNVILPKIEESPFLELAEKYHLYPSRITGVKGNASVAAKRSLIELGFTNGRPELETLTIENSRHDYTQEYIKLTKDFYLKM